MAGVLSGGGKRMWSQGCRACDERRFSQMWMESTRDELSGLLGSGVCAQQKTVGMRLWQHSSMSWNLGNANVGDRIMRDFQSLNGSGQFTV